MHVLLPTIGSAGDVHPMIGLGKTLVERNHSVTVLTNAGYQPLVEQAGLNFAPLGTREDGDAVLSNPDLWHPRRGFGVVVQGAVLPAIRSLYNYVAQHDPAKTVIAAHSLALGALLAHEKFRIPTATIHLQPSMLRSIYQMPITGAAVPDWMPSLIKRGWWRFIDYVGIDPLLTRQLNTIRQEYGLPPITRPFNGWIHAPQRVIGFFPPWFAPPQPDWPNQVRLVGFPLFDVGEGDEFSPNLKQFLASGAAPVLFTYGSAMHHGHAFFSTAVQVAQQLGLRAILLTSNANQIPSNLPACIHHEQYVPLRDLLPHVSMIVHHGGIGTLAQAFAAGTPQVIVPTSHDQPDNAQRIMRLGTGLQIPLNRFHRSTLAAAMGQILESPQIAARCVEFAERLNGVDARNQAATLLEQLVA